MAKLTDEKTIELKANFPGGLQLVRAPMGDFVFKKPSRAAFDKWRDGLANVDNARSTLARELAQSCLVFPGYDEYLTQIDDMPGLSTGAFLEACTEGTGFTDKLEVKKL